VRKERVNSAGPTSHRNSKKGRARKMKKTLLKK
jgi:hypothetical protein